MISSQTSRPLIIDGHADTAQRFLDESWNFGDLLGEGMLNLQAAREGGLAAQFFAIWVDPSEYTGQYAARALRLLQSVHEQVRRYPAELALCITTADVLQAHQTGRFGVLLGIEGGHCIEDSLDQLKTFYQLGARYMTLTWSQSVGWADSSGDVEDQAVPHVHGLSDFGVAVIREMNRLGMMIDVSHVSDDTFWAVLRSSYAPVIASHSSARALTKAPRNLTDEQLRAIADTGGIAMVNFFPAFLSDPWREAWNAQKPEREAAQQRAAAPYRTAQEPVPFAASNAVDRHFDSQLPPLSIDTVLDHIEHITAVAGPDHVGIGSDFDGIPVAPDGLATAAQLPNLQLGLAARGYTAEVIAKVLGGNLLRTFAAVEALAESAETVDAIADQDC